ncbi:MAG TPA: hypothetical protein VHU15_15790 [Stellaceae bacterium]|jgi:hypothetical protein|nr:hypothetical protein [Stellaceae bacterium]
MRRVLLIASALSLLPVAARADGFDWRDWYRTIESLTESLIAPAPPRHGEARVPAAAIDPKMALGADAHHPAAGHGRRRPKDRSALMIG